jgi:glycosyltransferase involved in cell wall biosynthesis
MWWCRSTGRPTLSTVVDGPQPETVEEVLARRLDDHVDGVRLIRTAVRSGFVAAVNRGMSDSAHDVVLLNSDTEVTAGWLDKLQVAAYSARKIATVTPLSNNATICSLPEFLEDNYMPAGISTDMMGDIVENASCRRYPNEFCNRATAAGFEHLADDATFIFHAGQQSFGADTARRRRAAMRTLRSMDRSYIPRVAAFIETDPMAPVRERVVAEIERRQGVVRRDGTGRSLSILHIVHGWPPFDTGGTEVYARRLAQRQTGTHRVSAFARIADDDRNTGQRSAYLDRGIRVRLVVNNFDRRNPIARNALKDRTFERELELFIGQTEPEIVHVHHLAGHCASLMGVVRRHGIPIVYQVQDWWALCARANLWRSDDTLCPGPGPARCARCLPLTALPPRSILNRALYRLRRKFLRRQLQMADAYVMGSRAVLTWHSDAGLLDQRAPAHIFEYGVPDFSIGRTSSHSVGLPITFGFIGTLMPHKGAHVAIAAFRGLPPDHARLVLWGNPDTRPDFVARLAALADSDPVDFKGRFDEDRKSELFASLDALIVPSVGLESFGIVAREAMSAGVPVLASRRGALEELDIDGVCGATFSADDPADLRRIIDRLIESPEILTEWRRALPEIVTVEEHADEIEEIYRQVLRDAG